ncbi:Transcriptional regulator, contains HTH domain [Halalkaliarchaeum sp. AArc-CO]|uniref:DUF6432 family protein n=1 Tax=unclassified Halalkaliarchaeum TaxID=2678344 RepID=UPI00217E186D|nr:MULTISPECIES: DUF6432 family protein [unclassified Halalkaliarchaeum]MDR5674397.1 DUF6432 family protein [Halalkaliarchaeum sp. AArc-GB]UWG52212.1 Transcriptional regulator, contains HTH domain [Halalkaliarchaeum sp. AArc-CO]
MQAKPEYRDRPDTEVAVLDALVDRAEEGMTVLELRTAVDTGIDGLEEALAALKDDGLIHVDRTGEAVRITPADRVVPESGEGSDGRHGFFEEIRERLGL